VASRLWPTSPADTDSIKFRNSDAQSLFANLEDGARIDDFLEWFPAVTRAQVEAVLRHAEQSLAVA